MRSCHTYGNGSACDVCHTLLDPFETYRVIGKTLHPGPRYPEVSSDLKSKDINKFHFCEGCYNNLIIYIKQLGLEESEKNNERNN